MPKAEQNHFKLTILRFWNVQLCLFPLVCSQEQRQKGLKYQRKGYSHSVTSQTRVEMSKKLTQKSCYLEIFILNLQKQNVGPICITRKKNALLIVIWNRFLLQTLSNLTMNFTHLCYLVFYLGFNGHANFANNSLLFYFHLILFSSNLFCFFFSVGQRGT